jgi:Fanconi anemia group J protein
MAVYRGKMSEGISFNDHYARGVLCVGIPFPSFYDPKVQKKKKYNEQMKKRADGAGKQFQEKATR